MKDVPIIFSAPMVAALLDGRKTMTRRLAWRLTDVGDNHARTATSWQKVEPGDRVWVRETHWRYGRWFKNGRSKKTGAQRWRFKAEGTLMAPPVRFDRANVPKPEKTEYGFHKRPAIFLERKFSRLTLVVGATKIERLQMIRTADAKAEGVQLLGYGEKPYPAEFMEEDPRRYVLAFEQIWERLHGREAWDANPYVVALTFKVYSANIDSVKEEAAA